MDEENRHLKIWIAAGVAVVLVLAVFPGRRVYRHFKENHDAAQAREFFAKGDYRNAFLSARQALLVNSNNVPACRVMVGLEDSAHSPAALDWCRRLAQLSPTITNKLLLASVGLRYQNPPYPLTTQVLGDLSASAANIPDFHILSAELDLSLHRAAEAESQFEAACRLEPTNRLFQLNLAVIRLSLTNAATAADARAKLKEFCSDPNLAPAALRSLVTDRLLHNDPAGALEYSTQLLAIPQAALNDRLQNLDILKRLQSPGFAAQLNALQHDSATNAVRVAQVASWMEANGFLPQTIRWLTNLPPAIQNQTPVRLAVVDCDLASTNWPALRKFTADGDWGDADFLRLAFLSRSWAELGSPLMASGDWSSAVSAAGGRLGALNALLGLANRWGMKNEQVDLLQRIVKKFPDEAWALRDLEQIYYTSGNTRALYQICAQRLPFSPKNLELKNNLAATALLLKTNLTKAFQWAAEVYAGQTNNPSFVTTYAYALHLQGRTRDGLAAMEKLSSESLKKPSTALYYGVLLSALGEHAQAAPYLALARKDSQLLPEEKQLLARALN
jgi:predicted Zn-dependent protease